MRINIYKHGKRELGSLQIQAGSRRSGLEFVFGGKKR